MPAPLPTNNVEYINSTDFQTLETRLTNLKDILDDKVSKLSAMRRLRYTIVDIESEREKGRIGPDELYIPQRLIDTNIRQEQSAYIQYVTESPRAVICVDEVEKSLDLSLLEQDLTSKLRFPGWQLGMYSNVDGFQANGYSVMESVYDTSKPGHIAREMVQYSDFAFINDTREIQNAEMLARSFYFTKTQLQSLKIPKPGQPEDSIWNPQQIDKILESDASDTNINPDDYTEEKDRSLYRIQKVMFRVNGVVNVGWVCIGKNDDWLRKPRPLFTGRVKLEQPQESPMLGMIKNLLTRQQPQQPQVVPEYETEYPYFLYPYLISENDTIDQLKGRVYLDQDTQEAVSSLMSSTVTQARRAAGMYFSKENSDPNDDVLINKNVFFQPNCLINANVKAFKIDAPDPGIFSAIQALSIAKQAETSQVSFAVNNRKDSRKTKKELDLAEQSQQKLSTVQVVLFSIALKEQFTYETGIIRSRVQAGLITVSADVKPLYDRDVDLKPSGDVDVLERQQLIEAMMNAWPVIQQTPAAPLFLADMLEKMFPNSAMKYVKAIQQGMQQQQSQQAQQQQAMMQQVTQMAQGIVKLSKEPQMFSDEGRIHAFPIIKTAAEQIEPMIKQMTNGAAKQ